MIAFNPTGNNNHDDPNKYDKALAKLEKDLENVELPVLKPKMAKFITSPLGEDMVVVERKCRVTGMMFSFDITMSEFKRWQSGEMAEDVWPDMPHYHLTILIKGYTHAEYILEFDDDPEWNND
tara:strand:+ start:804 stop:1172 length:369 start_codon:yes stop_codon:yes gene_type:complete